MTQVKQVAFDINNVFKMLKESNPNHQFQQDIIHKDPSQEQIEIKNIENQIERLEELLGGTFKEIPTILTLQQYKDIDILPSNFILDQYTKPQLDHPIYKLNSLDYASDIDKFNYKLPQIPNFQSELNSLLDYLNQEDTVKNLQMLQQTQLIDQQLDQMQQNVEKITIQLKQLTRDLNLSANNSENVTPSISTQQLL